VVLEKDKENPAITGRGEGKKKPAEEKEL